MLKKKLDFYINFNYFLILIIKRNQKKMKAILKGLVILFLVLISAIPLFIGVFVSLVASIGGNNQIAETLFKYYETYILLE